MFRLTRHMHALLPLLFLAAGLADSLVIPVVTLLAMLFWLMLRHRHIVGLVGVAPWASMGFARHVMVDDLLRLVGRMMISPLPYLVGVEIRHFALGAG